MHIFGKRLSALLLVTAIALLSVAALPQNVEAGARERQGPFTAERGGLDWESFWERFVEIRTSRGEHESRPDAPDSEPSRETTPDADPTPTAPPDQQTPPAGESTSSSPAASLDAVEAEVLDLINAHRQENGLAPLANASTLNISSHNHSQDMAENGYFSHTSLDGSSPFDRMRDAGYSCGTMGENIAAGQTSAQQVFEGWMNSPGHNANMLNPNFEAVGIGLVSAPDSPYGYYWTTNFGGC